MSTAAESAAAGVVVIGPDVVRAGVAALLDDVVDLQIVAAVATVSEARRPVQELGAGVVVLNVTATDGSHVSALRDLRAWNPKARVLVFTALTDDAALFGAIEAGAAGYLLKDASGEALVTALRRIARGAYLLDHGVRDRVLAHLREPPHEGDGRLDTLDSMEWRITDLISQGWTNQRISEHLGVSDRTVKRSVSNILRKLNATRRAEVAAYWARHRGGRSRGYLRRDH